MAVGVIPGAVGLLSILAAALCAIWFIRMVVLKDFFLPRRLIKPNVLGRIFPYCWVVGVTFTTLLVARWIALLIKAELFSVQAVSAGSWAFLPELWARMSIPAKAVVIVLFIMSVWSLAVIIDRAIYFNAARRQSREFAPKVAIALREGRLDEIVLLADRNKKSHLAEVVTAGLQEFRNYGEGGTLTEDQIESSKRALERAEAIVHAKLKRNLGSLATVGSTAPFIGLFGTVVGILNAFQQIATQKSVGIGAIAGGISEALVTTAFGLLVAIPAVMLFNYFSNKIAAFDVEMEDSFSELKNYFTKRRASR